MTLENIVWSAWQHAAAVKSGYGVATHSEHITFKNEANEADVSLVFGTLVPFYSTGTIVRKNLYKEAAIASYGDWNCLNPKYLGIIEIENLKDAANN